MYYLMVAGQQVLQGDCLAEAVAAAQLAAWWDLAGAAGQMAAVAVLAGQAAVLRDVIQQSQALAEEVQLRGLEFLLLLCERVLEQRE